jgi:AAA15 family ATPase/GTPase
MEKMVELFQDQRINTNHAQLIFTTHNTNLMDAQLLRRDQVWITEKDRFGATHLYSIAEYKKGKGTPRNKEAIETNYIEGKYGGVPFLGNWENYIESKKDEQAAAGDQ